MSKKEKVESCELVVVFAPKTGQIRDKMKIKDLEEIFGGTHFVREPEGGSPEAEALAITCRAVIKEHIINPMTEMVKNQAQEMITEWDKVKDRVEPLLQGKHAQCPVCGFHTIVPLVCDGDDFKCPDCLTELKFKKILNVKHPDQGYTVLVEK